MTNELAPYYQQLMKKYPMVELSDWLLLDKLSAVKQLKKGDSFLRVGQVCRQSAFLLSGQFKFSIHDEEGTEKIVKFGLPDDFLTNCESYNNKTPSQVSIIALEDSVLLKMSIKKARPLFRGPLNFLQANLYQALLEQQSEHQFILALKSPLQRYKFLLERRPEIIRAISLTNIARYLYISREAVSRARLYLLDQSRNFCD